MDLRSGETYWVAKDGVPARYPPLAGDETCDVAVIGGGIIGALVAHRLTEEGLGCVVLDRREVGRGSTAASTAILQYELDTPLIELAERIGEADAAWAYRLCVQAVEELERLAARLPGGGGVVRRPSLYLASGEGDVSDLARECQARRRAGIAVELLTRPEIKERFGFDRPAALRSEVAAEADGYAMTHALLGGAVGRGTRVYGGTAVTELRGEGGGIVLTTGHGPKIRARRVVLATGYEAVPGIKRWVKAKLTSTYAVATAPLRSFDGWEGRAILWETARPYFYARTTRDGRAMIGGEDEETADPAARDALIPAKTRALVGRLNALFPSLGAEPEFAWAGTFGESPDGLPYIGPWPDLPGVLVAVGLGGNGMTFGALAARVAAAHFTGRACPESRLFSLERPGVMRGDSP